MLPEERVSALLRFLLELPGAEITVDLASQTVEGPDGQIDSFEIDAFRKDCLAKGVDEITMPGPLANPYLVRVSQNGRTVAERSGHRVLLKRVAGGNCGTLHRESTAAEAAPAPQRLA